MLDPWVIDWIKRREREHDQRDREPLQLPLLPPPTPSTPEPDGEPPRNIIVIDLV